MSSSHDAGVPEPALADDAERKVALVLEHGIRSERSAAQVFVASRKLARLSLADYRQRIEVLCLFGHALVDVGVHSFGRGLESTMMPRLVFVQTHACARKHAIVLVLLSTDIRLPGRSIGTCGTVTAWHSSLGMCIRQHSPDSPAPRYLRCRPHWRGSLNDLYTTRAAKVQALVGAAVSFEEFKVVSGVAAIAAATAQLNRRLAARGATSLVRCSVLECGVQRRRVKLHLEVCMSGLPLGGDACIYMWLQSGQRCSSMQAQQA